MVMTAILTDYLNPEAWNCRMEPLFFVFALLHLIYLLLIFLVFVGLLRLERKTCDRKPFVSVVVAARNEENRILPTLNSLEKINYPEDRFEVILVDDASEDNTGRIIEDYVARHENWSMISLEMKSRQLRGKKKALKKAIEKARGELIFTTDADCMVPPDWLKHMVCYFDSETSMVLGHSPLPGKKGFLNRLLSFDNLFSAISAAAPTKLGFPNTSVGRNLAYRRDVYMEVGGFDALRKFRSGDDVHLTERFRKWNKGKIDYCIHPDTFVYTQLPPDARHIFHQQVRKNSKTLNKSLPSVLFSLVLFVYHVLLIAIPFLVPAYMFIWLAALLFKLGAEFFTLSYASWVFQKKYLIRYLIFLQVIYPAYIIFFSLLGIMQIYEWKK